jgi:quercetin dioxygenase-like cupin family protein
MQAGATRPAVHTISSDALPHVAGKNITTMIVEFPPGGFSPPHHHGGSVTVYVLNGTIRSQLSGQPPMVYAQGQTFFEPPGITHLVAENMSATEPARILAVFVADDGATLTTYHE